uniref:Conserved oligomeric Golgi complex subunit 7 n=1 Tax=Lepeophtheirus salmonis TaxID=72036 RepID=A0A0K2UIJ9_LEPSM
MDVRVFSKSDFDVNTWINDSLSQEGGGVDSAPDKTASTLVMKLQLLIAKLNGNLEEESGFLIGSLPRVLREAESLGQETQLLKSKMQAVQKEMEETKEEELIHLDTLKDRIQILRNAVQEADNWSVLTQDIQSLLSSETPLSLEFIDKFTSLQNSLKILAHVPDYGDRLKQLEGLKNQMEARVSPLLIQAFNNDDFENAKFFHSMFIVMERGNQVLKLYFKNFKSKLIRKWRNIVENEGDLVDWCRSYFTFVQNQIFEQRSWFTKVFSDADPAESMFDILNNAYTSLDPSFSFCMEANLKLQKEVLDYLIRLKNVFNEHAEKIYIEFVKDLDHEKYFREFAVIFYEPFKVYISRYHIYELSILTNELPSESSSSKELIIESQGIFQNLKKIIFSLESGSKRCISFTEGTAYPDFSSICIKSIISSYIGRYKSLYRKLAQSSSATQNWTIIQKILSLNQTAGELLLCMEELEVTLTLHFIEHAKKFLLKDSTESQKALDQHDLYLLDHDGRQKLEKFYFLVKQGKSYPILNDSIQLVTGMLEDLQSATFKILFHSIQEELNIIPSLPIWKVNQYGPKEVDLPDCSFSPQEYITKIGQYLMTLPQHLEPYMSDDNIALSRSLQECLFPYSGSISPNDVPPVDFILGCIATATCECYMEEILKISSLPKNAIKQLFTDIGYLRDILEDLGHPLSERLDSLMILLKVPYQELSKVSNKHSSKLVTFMLSVRGL